MTADPVVDLTPDDAPVVEATVEFYGQRFGVRDRVSLLPLMKFAVIARQQAAATQRRRVPLTSAEEGQQEMAALAALYDLLHQCIAEDEWDAFYEHAVTVGAGPQELMPVVRDAIAARGARPTQPPPRSPGGPSTTGPSSAVGSSSPGSSTPPGSITVQHDLEERGRPDLALVVKRARETLTATSPR